MNLTANIPFRLVARFSRVFLELFVLVSMLDSDRSETLDLVFRLLEFCLESVKLRFARLKEKYKLSESKIIKLPRYQRSSPQELL